MTCKHEKPIKDEFAQQTRYGAFWVAGVISGADTARAVCLGLNPVSLPKN